MKRREAIVWVGDQFHRYSSVWKIWGRNGQAYCTAKSFSGSIKLSIHTPDVCQFGFTREFREGVLGNKIAGKTSHVRWKRKSLDLGQTAPIAFLQFPSEYLTGRKTVKESMKKHPHFLLTPAPKGLCSELVFCNFRPPKNSTTIETLGEYRILFHLPIGEENLLLIMHRYTDFDREFISNLPRRVSESCGISDQFEKLRTGETLTDLSATLWSDPKDFDALRIVEINNVTARRESPEQL